MEAGVSNAEACFKQRIALLKKKKKSAVEFWGNIYNFENTTSLRLTANKQIPVVHFTM